MPSTSGDSSFTFVCDSNFGSVCLIEMTAVKPFAHVVAGDRRVLLLQQLVLTWRID